MDSVTKIRKLRQQFTNVKEVDDIRKCLRMWCDSVLSNNYPRELMLHGYTEVRGRTCSYDYHVQKNSVGVLLEKVEMLYVPVTS